MTGVGALATLLLLCSGTVAAAGPTGAAYRVEGIRTPPARVDLTHAPGRSALIDVHNGHVDALTVIAVHGFRGQPADLSPLIELAIAAGQTVKVFAHNDTFRSLDDSSRDLASAIEAWRAAHPNPPLRIDAHSMGGRIALGALARLSSDVALTTPIEINLIAVPLAGVESANWARVPPPFLPWVRA